MPNARWPIVAALVLLPSTAGAQSDEAASLRSEVRRLRQELDEAQAGIKARDERLDSVGKDVRALGGEVAALRAALPWPLAGPFLSAPPLGSDVVGVAKVAVFAPRLEVESARTHDSVALRLRRVEAEAVARVADLDLVQHAASVDLPIDRSGAVFVLEWSTTDGYPLTLQLKDGGSGQIAANVQVRPQQSQGRFLFVGYRTE
jgi:hypothetical protein